MAGAYTPTGSSKVATVVRVTSGNFLEMFDFFLFGIYAGHISEAFFPSSNGAAALLKTFGVFGAGFLMRPLGAIVLGAYVDRAGRRLGLIVTLGIMAMGTILIAFVPSYATIGLAAPALVLVGRLLQGFSAGVELGGVSVYLAEMAPPGRKGFYVAWQSGSQQVAIMVAALLGFALNQALTPAQMHAFGWRIPFFIGCAIIPFLFYIRRSLEETPEFLAKQHHPSAGEIFRVLGANAAIVALGMMMVVATTVSFYAITVYTPTFGEAVLHLSRVDSLTVTFCVALSNLFWLPVMGAVSDRFGRRGVLATFSALMFVSAYPVMAWLVAGATFGKMLAALLWLSFLYGSYNGAMVVALTEIVPADVRTSGFSLAYSLATALGGFMPMASTWLIATTGDRAAPGYIVALAGLCGLAAIVMVFWLGFHSRGRRAAASPSLAAPAE